MFTNSVWIAAEPSDPNIKPSNLFDRVMASWEDHISHMEPFFIASVVVVQWKSKGHVVKNG
jgi:hypothetical protein